MAKMKKRAAGGKAGNVYNAKGAPVMDSAEKTEADGFKKGGAAKKERKHGGMVEGDKAPMRMDRRARGGRAMASGGSPYSSAKATTAPTNKSSAGHEGESVGSV